VAAPWARELLKRLKERGNPLVLASSARQKEVDYYLDLLEARDLADAWTTSSDVESTKPSQTWCSPQWKS
jgi:phosphoglycolate phosphatase-like HAD superfamily hydrolase